MDANGLPSLLMQAAHSAALADGVLPADSADSTSSVTVKNKESMTKSKQNGNTDNADPTNALSGRNDNLAVMNAATIEKEESTTPPLSTQGQAQPQQQQSNSTIGSGDTNSKESNSNVVEAALAMVAVGNSKVNIDENENKFQQLPQQGVNPTSLSSSQPSSTEDSFASVSTSSVAVEDNTQPKSAGNAAHNIAIALAVRQKMNSRENQNTAIPTASATTTMTVATSNPPSISTTVPAVLPNSVLPQSIPTTSAVSKSIASLSVPRVVAANKSNGNSSITPTVEINSSVGGGGKKKGPPLRRGKWTAEEEAYANRLIVEFKAGLLPLTDGTTLRTFLSKLLNCDPMRISKKFVGSNCIGKQVFRRRTADINRLTPEQIQQSRAELSELERRFLERVAQTNRVKSSGVGNNTPSGNTQMTASVSEAAKMKQDEIDQGAPPSPPWLRPPNGFQHGTGAATAANALSSGTVNRTALIGRAMLQGNSSLKTNHSSGQNNNNSMRSSGSAGLLALLDLQRRQNQNLLAQSYGGDSANSLLGALINQNGNNNNSNAGDDSLSGAALAQMARNASAARMAGLTASGNSMTNLMMKTGLSRDQLSQLVRDHHNSSNSLSNMMGRQGSLDALMSLDFQSLQSIDNLANLIQTGGGNVSSRLPKSGMKNWSSDANTSTNSFAALAASLNNSNNNVASLANIRKLASEGRMESLIRSLSSGNVANRGNRGGGSNANFQEILQSMQSNLNHDGNNSANNLFGQASALDLAKLLRTDSSTGLTALRMQDGLAQRNTSVDDFLSLVASGDIPHQDPHLLNVPLQTVLQQQQNQGSNVSSAAQYLAQQQQLLAQASGGNNASLSQRIASFGGLNGNSSAMSLLSQLSQHQQQHGGDSNLNESAAAALLVQQQQAIARATAAQNQNQNNSNTMNTLGTMKRKFSLTDMMKDHNHSQNPSKR